MLVQTKEDILSRISEMSSEIAALGVQRFGLFGSFVKNKQDQNSDVDLLIEFKPGRKSFDNFMSVSFLLEEILGRKVDIVTPESLSRHIGPKIMAEIEYGVID